jgi:hypothetical protein
MIKAKNRYSPTTAHAAPYNPPNRKPTAAANTVIILHLVRFHKPRTLDTLVRRRRLLLTYLSSHYFGSLASVRVSHVVRYKPAQYQPTHRFMPELKGALFNTFAGVVEDSYCVHHSSSPPSSSSIQKVSSSNRSPTGYSSGRWSYSWFTAPL